MEYFDYALELWHPEKDHMPGAYEWWYFDAHLRNQYVVTFVFVAPSILNTRYIQYLADMTQGNTAPYHVFDYAQCKLTVVNEKGETIFLAEQDIPADQIRMAKDKLDVYFTNKNHLTMTANENLPDFFVEMEVADGKGNTAKANAVFSTLVRGAKMGRTCIVEGEVNNNRLYHMWTPLSPACNANAEIVITDVSGKKTVIHDTGFGYHDKNWGNHPMPATMKGWMWSSAKEEDLTLVCVDIPNKLQYPTFTGILIAYNGQMIVATEEIEYTKGKPRAGSLIYPLDATIRFKKASEIKGALTYTNIRTIFEKGPYSRNTADYDLDIEYKGGKIKRNGNVLVEFVNFDVR